MDKVEIKKYNPIKDYGGWGLRTTLDGDKAYNVSGNIGLKLKLKDKSTMLIGTQKPEELQSAIHQIE